MALAPAITDLEQLKNHPAVAQLMAWNPAAVEGAKFDRDEMSIYVERSSIREACGLLREDADCPFNYLADVTCVDWFPSEPRFEVIYHLLSISKKERVRLKVRLDGGSPALDSVTPVWPAANYFEREVFDLFGVRFAGHPYLRRLADAGGLGRTSAAQGLSGGGLPLEHRHGSSFPHARARTRSGPHHDPEHGAASSVDPRGAAR